MTIYSQFLPSFLQCCHTFYYIATTFAIGLTNNPPPLGNFTTVFTSRAKWLIKGGQREKTKNNGVWLHFLEPQLHQLDSKLPIIKFCFLWILFTRHWHQHHHHGSAWGLEYQTMVEIKEKKQNKTMLCSLSEH